MGKSGTTKSISKKAKQWSLVFNGKIKSSKGNQNGEERALDLNINLDKYDLPKRFKRQMINNCVEPEAGLHILNSAQNSFSEIEEEFFK